MRRSGDTGRQKFLGGVDPSLGHSRLALRAPATEAATAGSGAGVQHHQLRVTELPFWSPLVWGGNKGGREIRKRGSPAYHWVKFLSQNERRSTTPWGSIRPRHVLDVPLPMDIAEVVELFLENPKHASRPTAVGTCPVRLIKMLGEGPNRVDRVLFPIFVP
jgi:hypothetical protein